MLGKKKPDRSYLQPYEDATRRKGPGFDSQLWMSREAQDTRFGVLCDMGRFSDRVVADLGCGIGDFPIYIQKHRPNDFPKSYIGLEGVHAMAEHARERIEIEEIDRTLIEVGDFVADESLPDLLVNDAGAEVFVFSGSLNTLPFEDAVRVLGRFWDALAKSGRGTLIFNFLSLRHNKDRTPALPPAVRFDPVLLLEWSLERTPLVRMRHEYLKGHDATIVMDVVSD
ncbi:MAG: class I SAM-dependent methyltransferase [bacterium]|nr:class I SAM-dependent methyltransferase [bacterium]